ncbi:MAG: MBL fold metallo-hydrolase [Chloroflexi bacterium]|nr:MBL fold metallo-hydrolase [Chloroflexota bacterium]MBV9602293.1 MBL fold metallo-hydrolase [Chloroflexota bacterium]
MYFKQFLHDETGCASYFVASRQSREAAVIDPQRHIQAYLDLAQEREYRIVQVIDTHLHADHLSGNRALAAATGAVLMLHELADVDFPFQPLRDGQEVRLGQIVMRVVHTPGHRPESISLVLTNPIRSPAPSMVLSGDTLFVGDVGRPDFGGDEGALAQYASVQRLLRLEDYVEVFPAHFEGSCGKGMCGRPSTTIGFERRFNPVLQLSRTDFLASTGEVPPRPLNMAAILATNQGRGDYGWVGEGMASSSEVPSVSPTAAPAWIAEHHALVVDVREPDEFAAGHVPDAVSIPQAELALKLDRVPRDRDVLVACRSGSRSLGAARFLKGVGYDRVANLERGTLGWVDAGNPVDV